MLNRSVHRLLVALGMAMVVMMLPLARVSPTRGVRAQDTGGAMSIAIAGAGVDCTGSSCVVDQGSSFTLTVSVDQAPNAGYIGLGTQVVYQDLIYTPTQDKLDELVINTDGFPGIAVRNNVGQAADHGQTAGTPPFTTSHYTGPAVQIALKCTDSYSRNNVQLAPYSGANVLGSGFKLPLASGGAVVSAGDNLQIDCGQPAPGQATETPAPTSATPPAPSGPTGTAIARTTSTAIARVTATAVAAAGHGKSKGGGSNTGLWITIGAIAAAVVVLGAGGGAYYWRRTRQ